MRAADQERADLGSTDTVSRSSHPLLPILSAKCSNRCCRDN